MRDPCDDGKGEGRQGDIADILTEMTASREMGASHRSRMEHCMRHFAAKKIPLSVCADARHLNRQIKTLKTYARDLGLSFPDYTPKAMRAK